MEQAERTIVVRGKLCDPSHIELDEPVSDFAGAVEVTVRPCRQPAIGSPRAVLDVLRRLPRLDPAAVDELERSIETGKLPVRDTLLFDTGE